MVDRQPQVTEGNPFPLGATWDGKGTNFAVFSANAKKVEICIFDSKGEKELERFELPEYTDEIFHGRIEGVSPGTFYGLRVHGPYDPSYGHRFNHNKLLLDPYAKAHAGTLVWDHAIFGYTIGADNEDLSFDERDSASFVPKCVVVDPAFDWRGEPGRRRAPWNQTVIYEAHVKGFTKLNPKIDETMRGTYAGFGAKPVVDYIKSIGVTSVELLPVHTFVDDSHLLEKGLRNYWGYNSIGFFAPDPRYAQDVPNSLREFKEMVARYHEAGIEMLMDVVYNHTAEGNERGPTLSFKGIDNASYYRLLPDDNRFYINDTGTGNTVNLSHPRVIQLVMDSLRYWATEMHIDGFRFDLGTILAREPDGFNNQSGFLKAAWQDPVLSQVKLIAEPWDIGPGGYQVGHFPPGWAEWNDKFRDTARDFWRGEASASQLAPRLCASPDEFNHRGRQTWACVNFVTAHDGFTLNDTVSYNDKHNEANGEDGEDGSSDNRSWNCGAEGPTENEEILQLRERQRRNILATLLLAQGTPMVLAGDEFGRTQHGNNNAYCQDSEISWVDWNVNQSGTELTTFFKRLISMRDQFPIFRRSRFFTGESIPDIDGMDLTWIDPNGSQMAHEAWENAGTLSFGMLLDGRSQPTGIRKKGSDKSVLLIFNGYHDLVNFELPGYGGVIAWTRLVDTNAPEASGDRFDVGATFGVTGRSVLLFVGETS